MTRLRRDENGFTLIELLLAIVIVGIITVPLANLFFAYLRGADSTTARLSESHDVQIVAAYWSGDVASIGTRSTTSPYALNQSVETGVAYNSGLYPCGAAGTPNAIVRLAFDSFTGAGTGTLVRIAYVVQTVSGKTELHRLRCQGSATVVSDITLAHDLDPSTPPALTCSSTCTAAPLVPTTVTLTLSLKDPKNQGAAWTASLTGQRRQS
jgi:prepilin-type N-terminal cleavage/methylation domain-containing protein